MRTSVPVRGHATGWAPVAFLLVFWGGNIETSTTQIGRPAALIASKAWWKYLKIILPMEWNLIIMTNESAYSFQSSYLDVHLQSKPNGGGPPTSSRHSPVSACPSWSGWSWDIYCNWLAGTSAIFQASKVPQRLASSQFPFPRHFLLYHNLLICISLVLRRMIVIQRR